MEENKIEQKEKIKLIKGQRDNYGWEISIFLDKEGIHNEYLDKRAINRLEEIDKELKKRWGNGN